MRSFRSISILVLLISAVIMQSCMSNNDEPFDAVAQFEKEVGAIDTYLESNSIVHVKDQSGIRMVVTKLGNALPGVAGDNVEVVYKGSLFSTGEVFEEGTATGSMSGFIRGWQYALQTLPVGSEATIYIPSYQAYGNVKVKTIPENSTLVFDIKFNKTTHTALFKQQFKEDTVKVSTYIKDKQIQATKDTTGVWYDILTEGSGESPTWYSKVKLTYQFKLLTADGIVVGTYDREPVENFYSRVVDYIPGMQVALQHLKKGGVANVYIPSGRGLGISTATNDQGVVIVPSNSNLIVNIQLKEIY